MSGKYKKASAENFFQRQMEDHAVLIRKTNKTIQREQLLARTHRIVQLFSFVY